GPLLQLVAHEAEDALIEGQRGLCVFHRQIDVMNDAAHQRFAPGFQSRSPRPRSFAQRAATKSKSESRLAYLMASAEIGASSASATISRSARRITARATCRFAAAGAPPGNTNDVSSDTSSKSISISRSSRSIWLF